MEKWQFFKVFDKFNINYQFLKYLTEPGIERNCFDKWAISATNGKPYTEWW